MKRLKTTHNTNTCFLQKSTGLRRNLFDINYRSTEFREPLLTGDIFSENIGQIIGATGATHVTCATKNGNNVFVEIFWYLNDSYLVATLRTIRLTQNHWKDYRTYTCHNMYRSCHNTHPLPNIIEEMTC